MPGTLKPFIHVFTFIGDGGEEYRQGIRNHANEPVRANFGGSRIRHGIAPSKWYWTCCLLEECVCRVLSLYPS